ncbi:MAG: lipopolysaccharide heptosyltransferase II [Gemmatimonadales bacterium]
MLKILIVRFSSIGDLLLTTPLLRSIRERHPDAHISFVVREDMQDTLRHNPRIDELIAWRRGSSLAELARRLRSERWTHRLDLHGSLRSRLLRLMVGGRWTGYQKHRLRRRLLIMTHGRRGGSLGPVVERYFAAARDLDVTPDHRAPEFFTTPDADTEAAAFLAQHNLGRERPLLALAPGAAHFTKRWPAAHWVALAERMREQNDLLVLGADVDVPVADAIVAAAGNRAASAAGRYPLGGTAALLKRAAALVVGDTGVLHLATAVGTPVVGMYGPTVEAFGFFPYAAKAVIVQHALDCRPCSSQGGPVCPLAHHHCLVQMLPDEVATAVNQLRTSA